MHALDNPIWTALTTRHARFAQASGSARRYPPEVTALGAFEEPGREGYESLARLQTGEETTALFLLEPPQPPSGWTVLRTSSMHQMICETPVPPAASADWVELGEADVPDMLRLTQLTKPGPFGPRTHELGTYLGVRQGATLAALSGERMRLPGYTEVSAVCTHPDFLGRGYAASLISAVVEHIRARGETPFLHVRADNDRATALYRRLGFRVRITFQLAVVRKSMTA